MGSTKVDHDSVLAQYVLDQRPIASVSGANTTYAASSVLGSVIKRDTTGGTKTDTLPTAAALVSEAKSINPSVPNGASFVFVISVTGGFDLLLSPGSGCTIYGYDTVHSNSVAHMTVVLDNVSNGTEQASFYSLSSGGYVAENASDCAFSNTASGLTATTAQAAVDEIANAFYKFTLKPNGSHVNLPSGWSVTTPGTEYTVTHNLGKTTYVFAYSPQSVNNRRRASLVSINNNSFQVGVWSAANINTSGSNDVEVLLMVLP